MKIIYFLTIPFKPPPNIYYMKKKMRAKIAVYTSAPPTIGWREGGGVTCSDILVEHYANMSSYMSYLTQT